MMGASSDFDGERAVGVRFARRGANELVKVRREVVLSAGAIQSPLPDAADRYLRRDCGTFEVGWKEAPGEGTLYSAAGGTKRVPRQPGAVIMGAHRANDGTLHETSHE
jgi:hypothetical protein